MMAKRRAGRAMGGGAIAAGVLLALGVATSCGSDDAAPEPEPAAEGSAADGSLDAADAPVRARFGLDTRPANPTCKAPERPPSAAAVKFERAFANVQLVRPIAIAQMPGDPSRMFVAQHGTTEQGMGDIVSFPVASPPNVPAVVGSVGPLTHVLSEGGFLGMAFHPKCTAQSCRLYVSYAGAGLINYTRSIIGYLTSTDNGATFTGLTEILGFEDTFGPTHKGGGIAFGNDGFLYASFGDGDGPDDGFIVGQNTSSKASKVLRIDVDNVPAGQKYGIPADNPFKNGGGEPAVFAYGFRNPFRFSFDRATGDLWLGDVGAEKWEEIDRVELGGNYGWPCREGSHPYLDGDLVKCPNKIGLVDPVVEYEHAAGGPGATVIGGVVYRGKAIPSFVGTYLYAEFITGEVFTLAFDPTTGAAKSSVLTDAPALDWVQFGEDLDGEVYGVSLQNAQLQKLVPAAPFVPSTFPDRLSKTGCSDPGDARKPSSGLVPYGVNSPLWSDGATKERYVALPDGTTMTVGAGGDLDLPRGSVLVKTFALAGKRVETRLLVRHADGGWAGYTYEWLDDESDALLLPSSKRKNVGGQSWYFPTRGECMRCHTEAAGRTLGLELGQLNGDFVYSATNRVANQLETLEHIQMFAAALGKPPSELPVLPDPRGSGPVDPRARAYLHANCAQCHRPAGGGGGDLDLRFTTALKDTRTCNATGQRGDLGIAGAKVLVPGDPGRSLLSVRAHARGSARMPPLASSVVDTAGVAVVDSWIKGVTACP